MARLGESRVVIHAHLEIRVRRRARRLVDRPAYITGFDHRTECHNPSFRALDDSPSTRLAAEAAGLADGPVEVAELQAAFTHEELLLRKVLGLSDDVAVNPSGGALKANPIMGTGLCRIGHAADHVFGGGDVRYQSGSVTGLPV